MGRKKRGKKAPAQETAGNGPIQAVDVPSAQPEQSRRHLIQEYTEAFVIAIILAILIRGFIVQPFKIPSGSMIDTLLIGDHILVNKFIYGIRIPFTDDRWPEIRDPQRGDVIVFVYPVDRSKDFIKRIVAVGGDTVEIIDRQVYVNDVPIEEPYKLHDNSVRYRAEWLRMGETLDNMEKRRVREGHVFVMGDNRDHSHDSRRWGEVPIEDIKGKAFLVYFSYSPGPAMDSSPLQAESGGIRWGRFFKIIR